MVSREKEGDYCYHKSTNWYLNNLRFQKISKDFSRKYCYASDESSITLTIWTLNKPTWKPQSNKNQTETSLSATFCSTRQLLTQPNWLALLFRHSIINPTKHIFISKIQKKTRAKFKELKTSIEMRWNKWKHLRINFFFCWFFAGSGADFFQSNGQIFRLKVDCWFYGFNRDIKSAFL